MSIDLDVIDGFTSREEERVKDNIKCLLELIITTEAFRLYIIKRSKILYDTLGHKGIITIAMTEKDFYDIYGMVIECKDILKQHPEIYKKDKNVILLISKALPFTYCKLIGEKFHGHTYNDYYTYIPDKECILHICINSSLSDTVYGYTHRLTL